MRTHYNRHSVVLQALPWLMKPLMKGITGKASVLISIPMSHTYGIFAHQTAVHLGLRVIILPDPRTTEADQILFSHPAVLMGVAFGVPDQTFPGSERV